MFEQLLKVFEKAAGVDFNRSILLDTTRGQYIYSDSEQEYSPLLPAEKRSVCNVASFGGAVLEEAKRRENPTGAFMTVIFGEEGGVFYPDDRQRLDLWYFKRRLSQQWQALTGIINKNHDHRSFLRALQGVRPSIQNYPGIIREFRKVTFDNKTSVTSQPILEAGHAGVDISFTLDTKNGQTQTVMPGSIPMAMPFSAASSKMYSFNLELDVTLNSGNEPCFQLIFPEREIIIEQAISDEVKCFQDHVENLSDILVLQNY